MNKYDLIRALVDWVEKGRKTNEKKGCFIEIEDITDICGGVWLGMVEKNSYDKWVNKEKYIKIKESISSGGWGKHYSHCLLQFVKFTNKNDKNLIGYVIVRAGNHRIAIMENNNLKGKIYTKFSFDNDENFKFLDYNINSHDKKGPLTFNKSGDYFHPYLKQIKYEIQEGK